MSKTLYKTLHKTDWKSQVSCINSVVSDQFSAFCTLCNKTFKIATVVSCKWKKYMLF